MLSYDQIVDNSYNFDANIIENATLRIKVSNSVGDSDYSEVISLKSNLKQISNGKKLSERMLLLIS